MIPVKQVGPTCWPACVASILEVDLASLPAYPDAATATPEAFERKAREWHSWMVARNLFVETCYLHECPNAAPPGYSILNCRVDDDSCDLHSLVCLNGEVIWDPNGHAVPRDWNGIIAGRDWQVVEPFSWNMLIILDPTKPTGVPLSTELPSVEHMIAKAQQLFERLNARKPPARAGVSFGALMKNFGKIAAAYCDAATDTAAESAVLALLRSIGPPAPDSARTPTVVTSEAGIGAR